MIGPQRHHLFLDISDIIIWVKHGHKHYSGIQRVVVNTCVELRKAGGATLCYFDSSSGEFRLFECDDLDRFKMSSIGESWLTTSKIKTSPDDWFLFMGASWSVGSHLETIKAYCETNKLLFGHFVYDISPLSVPQTHKEEMTLITADWLSKVVRMADLLFTISEFSKNEIIAWAKEKFQRNVLIYPVRIGDEVLCSEQVPVESLEGKKFILNIGTLEARKNQVVLYQAYKILLRKYPREKLPLLVLVGFEGWFSGDARKLLFEDPDLKGLVVWLKSASDPQLEWLYSRCQFSVFSAIYEGWGLPVAESLARGKACVASRIDVFKEISADLPIYADPYSGEEWAREIERLHLNRGLLAQKEETIVQSYKTTLWSETADQVVKIFDRHIIAKN